MIHFVIFSECIKIFTPYVRKYVLIVMDPEECMFLNAIIVLLLCGVYFAYKIGFNDHKLEHTFQKYQSMTPMQMLFAFWIGVATVVSSMVVLTMDKHYNTPLMNNMLFKVVSVILLLLIGVIIFKEHYNYQQMLGMIMMILGGVLVFYHSDSSGLLSKSKNME